MQCAWECSTALQFIIGYSSNNSNSQIVNTHCKKLKILFKLVKVMRNIRTRQILAESYLPS